jgi:hypothetical protein
MLTVAVYVLCQLMTAVWIKMFLNICLLILMILLRLKTEEFELGFSMLRKQTFSTVIIEYMIIYVVSVR